MNDSERRLKVLKTKSLRIECEECTYIYAKSVHGRSKGKERERRKLERRRGDCEEVESERVRKES